MYSKRSNGGEHGTVYTNKKVVDFMLHQVDYTSNYNLRDIKILEPCIGDGIFILTCFERLLLSSKKFNFSFSEAVKNNFLMFEIDNIKINIFLEKLQEFLYINNCKPIDISHIVKCGDFLIEEINAKFDIIIGNPPYIRYDNIPDFKRKIYKEIFSTFKGRCDIYIPFYEKGLKLLSNNGKLCYICSNRWLKNDYGKNLRDLVSRFYNFEKIVNLEKIKVFDEDVTAYPAITIISNSKINFKTEYYEIFDYNLILDGLNKDYTTVSILNGVDWDFGQIKHISFSYITEQFFQMGIGVATGCDKIFISKSFIGELEDEQLIKIINSRNLRNNTIQWNGEFLLNPYGNQGEIINLQKYPKIGKYLETHKDILMERYVAKRTPNNWYKTIDKVKINLINKHKLLLPDISSNTFILYDHGEYYPHHNLVYITHENESDLKVLGAILSSDFGKQQMRKIGNLMNGGYIRWQIQNLKKLKIPNISQIDQSLKDKIIFSYEKKDIITVNELINGYVNSFF